MQRTFDRLLLDLPLVGALWRRGKYPLLRLLRYYLHAENRRQWAPRIRDAMDCADNCCIPRVSNAGRLVKGYLVMHNGLRVLPESYYGEPMRLLLEKNKGVHEPQEERVFMEVLRHMPREATMLELGAYWGFYSMWFHQQVAKPHCYLVEPHPLFLEFGKQNFAANQMQGRFFQAYVGAKPGRSLDGASILAVDQFIAEQKIEHVNILHADIQEAELQMLQGSERALAERRIDYIFISTHSNALHQDCRAFLQARRFTILADADLDETFSFDGLLVARRSELEGLAPVAIAKKRTVAINESSPQSH